MELRRVDTALPGFPSSDSSVPSLSSFDAFRRSQAEPFKLPLFSAWWGDARHSSGQSGYFPERNYGTLNSEGRGDDETEVERRGHTPETERQRDGIKACVLPRLEQQFRTASFWVIDGRRDAKNKRVASERSVYSAPSCPPDCEVSVGEGGTHEVLPPVFRLPLRYSCNLTLVGKRLCGSDLLLRPLAVVHTPHQALGASELIGVGEKHVRGNAEKKGSTEEKTKRSPDRPEHGTAETLPWEKARAGARGHTSEGVPTAKGSSGNGLPFLSRDTGSSITGLYLRHITLNTPASSGLALSFGNRCTSARTVSWRARDSADAVAGGDTLSPSSGTAYFSPVSADIPIGLVQPWGPAFSYGLLLVQLAALPESVRDDVLRATKPFGAILEERGINRRVCIDNLLHIHITRDFFGDDAQLQKMGQSPAAREGQATDVGPCDPSRRELEATDTNRRNKQSCVRAKGCTCVFLGSSRNGETAHFCTFGRWSTVTCDDTPAARVLEILNARLIIHAASALHSFQDRGRSSVPGRRSGDQSPGKGNRLHDAHSNKTSQEVYKHSPGSVIRSEDERDQQQFSEEDTLLGGKVQPNGCPDSEEAKDPVEYLSRVCLCSAQECPVHGHWLQIPPEWAPPLRRHYIAEIACQPASSGKEEDARLRFLRTRKSEAVGKSRDAAQGKSMEERGETAGKLTHAASGVGEVCCSVSERCFNCGSELCVENFPVDAGGRVVL
ncbi:hypothetical protein CSUI_008610 [Cystoisospora suis]|uniref:Uncharacterized protein n=1 Tax=Cystoisospora suis TaxID=483139 RepID=A0A2C6JMB8_9APIC|nr:hypothetical protein CSUI_008610 [Cystoisospora suis]